MALESKPVFRFGEFRADAGERRLVRNGEDVPIAPKSFDALLVLLENAGKLVERETLRRRLWDANIVEESALARVIADLRKALGDSGHQYLVTVPKFGYRLATPVERILAEAAAERPVVGQAAASPAMNDLPHPLFGRRVVLLTAILIVGGLSLWIRWPQRQPVAARTREPAASAVGNRAVARLVWASLVDGKISLSTIHPVYGSTLARVYGPAISRDGRFIAFTWNDVWLHDLVSGEERHLAAQPPSDQRLEPAIVSPDGKLIAYVAYSPAPPGTAELWLIGADGSGRRRLLGGYGRILTPAWSPDGKQILASVWNTDKHNLSTAFVSVSDGSSSRLGAMASPRLSPDRRYIAFVRRPGSPETDFERGDRGVSIPAGDIYIHSMEQGTDLPLVENFGAAATPVWAPDGKSLLFVSDRNGGRDLWSIQMMDGKALGPPEMIRERVEWLLDVSGEGDCYYQSGTTTRDLYLAGVDPQTGKLTSQPLRITSRYANGSAAWSPDGKLLAYYRGTIDGREPLLIVRSMAKGEERELLPKAPLELASWQPQWFPDGRGLLVHASHGGLLRVQVATGEYQPLPSSAAIVPYADSIPPSKYFASFVLGRDGRTIYFLTRDSATQQTRILSRDLNGGQERELGRVTAAIVRNLSLSPDGRQLAFLRAVAQTPGETRILTWSIMTMSANGGGFKELYKKSSAAPWRSTVWSKDGQRLFFLIGGAVREAFTVPVDGGEPRPLGIGLHDLYFLDRSPDGKQLMFADEQWNNQLWVLKNSPRQAKE